MNFAKINMILLIVVIVVLAVIFYFVFVNKKETGKQNDALAEIMNKLFGGKQQVIGKQSSVSGEQTIEQPAEPNEDDWKNIYAISEKIFNGKKLTKAEEAFNKKFVSYINDDIKFCKQFYPVVDKFMQGEELTAKDKEFYEANKEQVDDEVNHRKSKSQVPSTKFQEAASTNNELTTNNEQRTTDNEQLSKANPPINTEERTKTILSFFEDKIPKTVKQIQELLTEATGHDFKTHIYRVVGQLEGKFIVPFDHKVMGQKVKHFGLPEWFEGKKIKQQYKNNIA